jgi:hypothetical protein
MSSTKLMKLRYLSEPSLWCQQRFFGCVLQRYQTARLRPARQMSDEQRRSCFPEPDILGTRAWVKEAQGDRLLRGSFARRQTMTFRRVALTASLSACPCRER